MTTKQARRPDIPAYSKCCHQPVLARSRQLYCHGCRKTVVDFRGKRRRAALEELRWERTWPDYIGLHFRNLRVAYARDITDLPWNGHGYDVVIIGFKWFIECSVPFNDAVGLMPPDAVMDYPGRSGFATLDAAAEDLWSFLCGLAGPIARWDAIEVAK